MRLFVMTARMLKTVCALDDDRAYDVMMQAHRFGFAVVGQYPKEECEVYCETLRGAGIMCDVSKADNPN
jgi:ATP-dependent Clp protease adapter protein ClpS